MQFELWAGIVRRSHVLDGGPAVLRGVAMANNFGTQLAITGFVGYNFGCMIVATRCLILEVFLGQAIRQRHSRDRASKERCHGNQFWGLELLLTGFM